MRFHQRVTQLLQENPPSTQFPAVPVLVYFTPYYKSIVGAHINDVEENFKGPTGSHASAAVCGYDLVQVINPSLCLVVVQDHLWFSVFSGAQDSIFVHSAHQQDNFPFLGAIRDDSGSVSKGGLDCKERVIAEPTCPIHPIQFVTLLSALPCFSVIKAYDTGENMECV